MTQLELWVDPFFMSWGGLEADNHASIALPSLTHLIHYLPPPTALTQNPVCIGTNTLVLCNVTVSSMSLLSATVVTSQEPGIEAQSLINKRLFH